MNDRHFSSPILKRRIHATGCRLQKRQKLFERLELRHLMSADAVLDWNEVALQAVANDHTPSIVSSPDQGGPTRTSRALGIVHAAIFDAANAIDRSFTPYQLRSVGPTTASIDAAVAQAAYDTLSALYPKQAALFDAALASTLDDVPDGMSEAQGIAIGGQAAKANLDARRNDRSNLDGDYFAIPIPGRHRVDPLHPDQPYLTPDWGKVKPFTLKVGSQFRSDPPPRLSSLQYAAAFNEVKRLGGDGIVTPTDRSPEQTAIGIYWGYDGTPGLGTPPTRLSAPLPNSKGQPKFKMRDYLRLSISPWPTPESPLGKQSTHLIFGDRSSGFERQVSGRDLGGWGISIRERPPMSPGHRLVHRPATRPPVGILLRHFQPTRRVTRPLARQRSGRSSGSSVAMISPFRFSRTSTMVSRPTPTVSRA
jgi:hypothetical protein